MSFSLNIVTFLGHHHKLESTGHWNVSKASNYDEMERRFCVGGETPLLDKLTSEAKSGDATFHFPGHKRGVGAPERLINSFGVDLFSHDLPELPELDNLFAPEGAIRDSQRQAKQVFGSDSTFFLINGSTVGIQAAIMATCSPGKTLILPRNAHQSAFSSLVLSGATPKYVLPEFNSKWNLSLGVMPQSIELALNEAKETGQSVGAVLIVSPTYHGICSDIEGISEVCHKFGVPLIVDEAHGAHLLFSERLPPSALEQGADIAIQSTHKVLGSLTQSAMLHLKHRFVSESRISSSLQVLQSSSPSYLLLASLDAATWQMATPGGRKILEEAIDLSFDLRRELNLISGISVLGEKECGPVLGSPEGKLKGIAGWDPLRVTISALWGLKLTGFAVDNILRDEFGVVAELPTLDSLTFALSGGTTETEVKRLIEAYKELSLRFSPGECEIEAVAFHPDKTLSLPTSSLIMTPREAFFSESERVSSSDAIGRVSANLLCPYPPGIPVLVPGEIITEEAIDFLESIIIAGGSVSGALDSNLDEVAVINSQEGYLHGISSSDECQKCFLVLSEPQTTL